MHGANMKLAFHLSVTVKNIATELRILTDLQQRESRERNVWYLLKGAQVRRPFSSQKIAGESNMNLDMLRRNRLYFSVVCAATKKPCSKLDRPHIQSVSHLPNAQFRTGGGTEEGRNIGLPIHPISTDCLFLFATMKIIKL